MDTNYPGLNQEVSLMEMLDAREARCNLQKRLLTQYETTLICLTLNIPGPVKILDSVPDAFEEGLRRLHAQMDAHKISVVHREIIKEKTGYEAFYSVCTDANTAKQLVIFLEDQDRLGRLFDIDVLRRDGTKVSREDLGQPPRTCLLCGQQAQICARSRRHGVGELVAEIRRILASIPTDSTTPL